MRNLSETIKEIIGTAGVELTHPQKFETISEDKFQNVLKNYLLRFKTRGEQTRFNNIISKGILYIKKRNNGEFILK